ncbi:hypothetical protein [Fusibacter sp. JL216-2]|uniref:hypothetical protein n=1 Tax=Fusibacter sp. JL216-2 TaxID=3071453 RepID=UPI003D32E3E4
MKKTIKLLLLFMFIYNIVFSGLGTVASTGKIATLILSLYVFSKKKINLRVTKSNVAICSLYFMILLYAILNFLFNGLVQSVMLARIIFYFLNTLYMSFVLSEIYSDTNEFMLSFFIITTIQAVFIIAGFVSYEFRVFVSELLLNESNISILSASRSAGFTNSSGANLSVIQALGFISGLLLITRSNKINIIYYIAMVVIIFSIVLSGRTGFVLILIMLIPVISVYLKRYKSNWLGKMSIFKYVLVLALGLFIINVIMTELTIIPYDVKNQYFYIQNWIKEAFVISDNRTINALTKMEIPKLDYKTFVGTSLVVDSKGLNASGHDSGYIQTYFAMGLVFSIIFYFTVGIHLMTMILKNYIKLRKTNLLHPSIFFLMSIFILEVKEPFIFKSPIALFLLVLIKLAIKDVNTIGDKLKYKIMKS